MARSGLRVKVNVRGLDRLGELARLNLEEAVELEAREIAADAAARAPVRSGDLRDSIEAVPLGPYQWEVHDGVPYGVHQEYGTRHMAARPFMTPAFAAGELRFPVRVKAALEQAIRDASEE